MTNLVIYKPAHSETVTYNKRQGFQFLKYQHLPMISSEP
jgi:hypothetical protein